MERRFFQYAKFCFLDTRDGSSSTVPPLADMNVDVDVHKWANVSERHADEHAFDLWDVLFVRLDDDAVDVIELACEHQHDAWLSRRAEECALYAVHPYLISFLPLDTFITIMERHWGEWVPVFLDWIQTTQNITSRRMWRRFLRHMAHHGPIEWYPQALRVMDMVATWKSVTTTRAVQSRNIYTALTHPFNRRVPSLRTCCSTRLTSHDTT